MTDVDEQPAGRRAAVRRWAPVAGVGVGIIALSIFLSRMTPSTLPLDPASTQPDGTKALALILEEAGAEVSILDDVDDPDVATLLVLVDNLGDRSDRAVAEFVTRGGTAVIADPTGDLGDDLRPAGSASSGFVTPTLERQCDVAALDGINQVRPGASPLFVVPPGATGCFGRGERAWLIIRDRDSGTMITTGGSGFLVNSLIAEVDNAALAVALLAPSPGTRVGILRPTFGVADGPGPGSGDDQSLGDLIPAAVYGAALQLTIAFGIVVLWRMRRLGKPVREHQAVRLAGSELVLAVGNLFQRTGARRRATQLLREDFRRSVARRLGVAADLPAEDLAEIAAARTGIHAPALVAALDGPVPDSDAAMVELAQRLEALRSEMTLSSSAVPGA